MFSWGNMKRFLFLLLIVLLSLSSHLNAQFPITVKVVWDAYPASAGILKFTVTFNGTPADFLPTTICNTTECVRPLTLTNSGPHTVSITATNSFGISPPVEFQFKATSPGKSGRIKIELI